MKIIFLLLLLPLPFASFFSISISYEAPFNDLKELQSGKNLSIRLESPFGKEDHISTKDLDKRHDSFTSGKQDFKDENDASQRHGSIVSGKQDLTHVNDTSQSLFVRTLELISGYAVHLWPVVLLVVGASLKLCSTHIKNFKTPNEQRPIIVIAILPSVYAMCSYIGLFMTSNSAITVFILDGISEGYSAFVSFVNFTPCNTFQNFKNLSPTAFVWQALYMFYELIFAYLVNSLGNGDVNALPEQRVFQNFFPMTLFQPYVVRVNAQTLRLYRRYTLQYVVIHLLGSGILILLQVADKLPAWGVRSFNLVSLASGTIAVCAVVIFFQAVKGDISGHAPGQKLLCLKASVLFSFSQVYAIWALQQLGFFDAYSSLDIPFTLQNFLLLLEMVPYTFFLVSCYSCTSNGQRAPLQHQVNADIKADERLDEEADKWA